MSAHTSGPYLREGRFVYALTEYRLPSGKVLPANRFDANVSRGCDCSEQEAEAVARLFQAAPELLEALQEIADCTTPGQGVANEQWINQRALTAIAKATGAA